MIGLAVLTSSAFAANPVYLDCQFSENRLFKVTLDEDAGRATMDYGTGKIATYAAKFSPNDVRFVDDSLGGVATSIFTIDRTSLKMIHFIPSIKSNDAGQYKLVQAPKNRKF
ncbi:MAG: hypothetical protein WAQ53_14910 [Thiofilum sp.]|uniref:hypothetical protein n=1 Tax=Thiofilum sp. TaxID=2212733 RepID=UPI0025CDAC75|nr:hypothetical protein [Thiofilum sp.]MBK8451864.1 hypothetical protein [Thiofilum sp.]